MSRLKSGTLAPGAAQDSSPAPHPSTATQQAFNREMEKRGRNMLGEYGKSDTPIQNIIDEIVGLYLSTLYKLRFLA